MKTNNNNELVQQNVKNICNNLIGKTLSFYKIKSYLLNSFEMDITLSLIAQGASADVNLLFEIDTETFYAFVVMNGEHINETEIKIINVNFNYNKNF